MPNRHLHETKPERLQTSEPAYVNEQLLPMQRIEGGPPKPILFSTLPRPLRIFGYGLVAVLISMPIIAIVASMLK